jgi:hypothetical protein
MSDIEDDGKSVSSRTSGFTLSQHIGEQSLPKKRTPRASKKDLDSLRLEVSSFQGKVNSIDSKLDFLQEFLKNLSSSAPETATLVGQRPVTENNQENIPPGECRPVLPLHNDLNIEFDQSDPGRQDDVLSLQPGQHEHLSDCWDNTQSVITVNSDRDVPLDSDHRVHDRFTKYSKNTETVLAEMFGDDAVTTSNSEKCGITLDCTQVKILADSWRCSDPSKLTAYKDSYRSTFPVSEKSEDSLSVPSLDSMVETLLVKKFGNKASKAQSLCSQPLRSLEKLAYQGQHAARMGLVINIYMQQALSNLLLILQDKKLNIDSAIQCVRDIFAMSTKSLDQTARTGAFHHLIRRRAAMADTGLQDVRDLKDHLFKLPFSHEGVFGSGLEQKLKERKELNSQLSDLLPETDRKRKLPPSTSNPQWKKTRFDNTDTRSRPQNNRPFNKAYSNKTQDQRNSATFAKPSGVSTFRNKSKRT